MTPDLTPPLCDLCVLEHVLGGGLGSIGRLEKWTKPPGWHRAVHFARDSIGRSTFGLGLNVAVSLSGSLVSGRSVYSGLEVLLDGAVGNPLGSWQLL